MSDMKLYELYNKFKWYEVIWVGWYCCIKWYEWYEVIVRYRMLLYQVIWVILKVQVMFRKRAINNRTLLQKIALLRSITCNLVMWVRCLCDYMILWGRWLYGLYDIVIRSYMSDIIHSSDMKLYESYGTVISIDVNYIKLYKVIWKCMRDRSSISYIKWSGNIWVMWLYDYMSYMIHVSYLKLYELYDTVVWNYMSYISYMKLHKVIWKYMSYVIVRLYKSYE